MFRSVRRRSLRGGEGIYNFKRPTKRSNKSGKVKKRSNKSGKVNKRSNKSGKVSFAAKLAAFILEGLHKKPRLDGNDANMQKEVSGAIPYLHMNIKESDVVNKFKETEQMRIGGLSNICKNKGLESSLSKVNFSCDAQSKNGVLSINKSIVDSINNRWNIRQNGRKHLKVICKYMVEQYERGEIPKSSLKWCNVGKDHSKF
jgi:hypothetical protein